MKSRWFLTGSLMVLMGCQPSPTPSTSETPASSSSPVASLPAQVSPTVSPTASEPSPVASLPAQASPTASPIASEKLSPPTSAAFTISEDSIGPAKVGVTLGQLKKLLAGKAEFKVKSPFIVDFDAIAVSQGGTDQYYILYPAGAPLPDSAVIEALVTDNPNYRTAQGVGPGTPLTQAEAVYGDATLVYNSANESREYVKFAKFPSKAIAFRAKAPQDQQFAGVYPASKSESKQTQEYQKSASIGLVEVLCRQNCPLPSP